VIHHAEDSTLVVTLGVLDEGDQVSLGRDPDAGQVALGLVQHLADRIFESFAPQDGMDRGQVLAVG
jgi:hypothetical protein